jgi:hypothetical protein
MLLLGCKPKGRLTEQHDIFFGIAGSLKELIPQINSFWKEAKGNIHIDAWREVRAVDGYSLTILPRTDTEAQTGSLRLFFINMGGYKPDEFDEHHSKIIVVTASLAEAIKKAKSTLFYKETGFKGAASHIDDKYALDVDDIFEVSDILPEESKTKYYLELLPLKKAGASDEIHLGYLQLSKIKDHF